MNGLDFSFILSVCLCVSSVWECLNVCVFTQFFDNNNLTDDRRCGIAHAHTLQLFVHTLFRLSQCVPFWSLNSCSGSNHWWWLLFISLYIMYKNRINISNTWLLVAYFFIFVIFVFFLASCFFFSYGVRQKRKISKLIIIALLYAIAHCLLFTFYLLYTTCTVLGQSTKAYFVQKKIIIKS